MKALDRTTIKPCPFCGSDDLYIQDGRSRQEVMAYRHRKGDRTNTLFLWINCENCGANITVQYGKPFETCRAMERDLVERWNRRA